MKVLERTKLRGASFSEVLVSQGESSLKRISKGQVYQPTAGEGMSISFSCIIDGKRVNSACDSLKALDEQIENMFFLAKDLPREENLFVPDRPFPKVTLGPGVTYDEETAKLEDERLIETIGRVNEVLAPEGFIFAGSVSHGRDEIVFANSIGTYQSYISTRAALQIFGFDPKDYSISALRTVAGKSLSQFPVEELAKNVADKLSYQREYLTRSGGKRIDPFEGKTEPRRFDVIMEPSCWAGLLAIFSGSWNGKEFHDGTSFFSGKLGSQVMGKNITIFDDPMSPDGIPKPFDWEGHPTEKLALVEGGIARNVVYDSALAKKYGTNSTGHALPPSMRYYGAVPEHLVVKGGDSSVEEMIRESKDPTLWITTLHYIRCTHQQDGRETGTTLHGVFLVKDGEVVGPTEHLRFEESVPEALSRVTHLGRSLPTLSMETDETPYIVPPMRSEGFRFVSVADRKV